MAWKSSWSNADKIPIEKLRLEMESRRDMRKALRNFRKKPYLLDEKKEFKEILTDEIQKLEETNEKDS